jgi:dipeptidyl aminopeptidase/acylaminoacyl peptidase
VTASGFWRFAGLVVAVLSLLVVALLAVGGARDLVPSWTSPADGNSDVSERPVVRITYRHAVDAESLRAAFHTEPSLDGTLETDATGLRFVPARALVPGALYSVVIAPGVRDLGGRTSRSPVRVTFRPREPRLVVLHQVGPVHTLEVVSLVGVVGRRISPPDDDVALAAISPDGHEVAYAVRALPIGWTLWAVPVAGGAKRMVAADDQSTIGSLAWSPRGDLLAYESSQVFGSRAAAPRLWVVRADGGQPALLYGRAGESGSAPSWAPDGRGLAFFENRLGAIALFDFTGRLRTIRTEIPAPASWAPDGRAIAFTDRSGETGARSVVKVADVHAARVGPGPDPASATSDGSPAWSPTGEWIAFTRQSGSTGGIWISRPDGTDPRSLHRDERWLYGPPLWDPAGRAVAFSRRPMRVDATDDQAEVVLAPLDGPARLVPVGGSLVGWLP